MGEISILSSPAGEWPWSPLKRGVRHTLLTVGGLKFKATAIEVRRKRSGQWDAVTEHGKDEMWLRFAEDFAPTESPIEPIEIAGRLYVVALTQEGRA
jgi:hypothetical protein